MIKAVERYDPARKSAFSTYAQPIIEHAIISAIICDKDIKIPESTLRRYLKLKKQLEEEITELESEKKHGISQRTMQQIWAANQTYLSLSELENEEENNTVRSDRIAYPPQDETNLEDQKITREALSKLEKTQAQLLMLRWGLGGSSKHTREETAKILGVTYSQERRMEEEAKAAMRLIIHLQRLWDE